MCSLYVLAILHANESPLNETCMANQIVITEKTSQAKDVRAAVGSRYGDMSTAVWIRAYSAAGAFWTEGSGLSR